MIVSVTVTMTVTVILTVMKQILWTPTKNPANGVKFRFDLGHSGAEELTSSPEWSQTLLIRGGNVERGQNIYTVWIFFGCLKVNKTDRPEFYRFFLGMAVF